MPTIVEQIPGKTWPCESGKQMLSPTVSTAVTLTPPKGASWALIQALSAPVRWWDDGSTPTVSQGFQLVAGVYFEFSGDFLKFKAIAESGTPTLNVSYYRSNPTEVQGQ
jgi:hypothetical protein